MIDLSDLGYAVPVPASLYEAFAAFAAPAYPPFFAELRLAGTRLVPIGLTGDGAIDLDALERALADGVRVLVLANRTTPPVAYCRGASWRRSARQRGRVS